MNTLVRVLFWGSFLLVGCANQPTEIMSLESSEYSITLNEQTKGLSLAEVSLSLTCKENDQQLETVIYSNDAEGDFGRHYPNHEWLYPNLLRFYGTRTPDSKVVLLNESESSLRMVRIVAGENLYLVFDLESSKKVELPFVGGNASGWLRYKVIYSDGRELEDNLSWPESALPTGTDLIYSMEVNPDAVTVRGIAAE